MVVYNKEKKTKLSKFWVCPMRSSLTLVDAEDKEYLIHLTVHLCIRQTICAQTRPLKMGLVKWPVLRRE